MFGFYTRSQSIRVESSLVNKKIKRMFYHSNVMWFSCLYRFFENQTRKVKKHLKNNHRLAENNHVKQEMVAIVFAHKTTGTVGMM